MALWHDVEEDSSFTPESDPVLRKMMKRKAGAEILQDIGLNTYLANTMGRPGYKAPVFELYMKELKENMISLMQTRMNYYQLEDFLTVLGYEADDIRKTFRLITGIDPAKMEYMRQETVNKTPANIPWYNMGWGMSKDRKRCESYFVMPSSGGDQTGLYTVWCQVDDMRREEVANFLLPEQALSYIKPLVSHVYRYDMPASEEAIEYLAEPREESTKPEYQVFANTLWDMRKKGTLDTAWAERYVRDAVFSGSLSQKEGNDLLDLYVYAGPPAPIETTSPDHSKDVVPMSPKQKQDLDYRQDTGDVRDEIERNTPQDFFESVLPERMDTVTPLHVKEVLSYISHRGKDMTEFDIRLHSLEYMKHETPRVLVETNPDTGRPAGPPRATVSVILEISDLTLPDDHNRKYALSVFFVSPDGEIGTSDSVKGEDDIIYGFSEDGFRQYFSRDRMVSGKL